MKTEDKIVAPKPASKENLAITKYVQLQQHQENNMLLGSLEVLDSLDSLGPVSNFCNNFSSTPDLFPRSSTSSQFTDLIINQILVCSLSSIHIF